MNVEVEIGVEDVLAEETIFLCLFDRMLQAAIGKSVFTADIDITFICAEGITCNRHRFQDGVWIAFEHNAVLESAGFALVGVADNVFLGAVSHADKFPFAPGGEACTTASLQARFLDSLDYLLRSHLAQGFTESLISILGDKLFDVFRVDAASALQDDALLCRVVS